MRNDEWQGLADFLANMIEKYAVAMNIDELPDRSVVDELGEEPEEDHDLELIEAA